MRVAQSVSAVVEVAEVGDLDVDRRLER